MGEKRCSQGGGVVASYKLTPFYGPVLGNVWWQDVANSKCRLIRGDKIFYRFLFVALIVAIKIFITVLGEF